MKRILVAYKDLIGIIFEKSPIMVILTFLFSIVSGLLAPIGLYVNQHVFDDGLRVARGEMTFKSYSVYLVVFIVIALLPHIISAYTYTYVEARSLLILRTSYKSRMLKKLKAMKYEHFENETSVEIIDKAYNRAENSARHLWPMYVVWWISSFIASVGSLIFIARIRWWLLLTVLIPFVIETYIKSKTNYNIYTELET